MNFLVDEFSKWRFACCVPDRGRDGTLNGKIATTFRNVVPSRAGASASPRAVEGLSDPCSVPPLLRNWGRCNFHQEPVVCSWTVLKSRLRHRQPEKSEAPAAAGLNQRVGALKRSTSLGLLRSGVLKAPVRPSFDSGGEAREVMPLLSLLLIQS